jgi:hypothetical protein
MMPLHFLAAHFLARPVLVPSVEIPSSCDTAIETCSRQNSVQTLESGSVLFAVQAARAADRYLQKHE